MEPLEPDREDITAHAAPAPGWHRTRAGIKQRAAWMEEYLGKGWVELEPGIYSPADSSSHTEPIE